MKICKIYIKNFEQFQDIEFDFTNPDTGEPLDKICFIGSNGTGKSKLLSLIKWYFNIFNGGLNASLNSYYSSFNFIQKEKLLFKVLYQSNHYFIFCKKESIALFKSDESLILNDDFASKIINDNGNLVPNYHDLTTSQEDIYKLSEGYVRLRKHHIPD